MCWGGVEHARDNLETRGHDVTLLFSMSPMCSLLGAITARRIILNLLCRAVHGTLEPKNKIRKHKRWSLIVTNICLDATCCARIVLC